MQPAICSPPGAWRPPSTRSPTTAGSVSAPCTDGFPPKMCSSKRSSRTRSTRWPRWPIPDWGSTTPGRDSPGSSSRCARQRPPTGDYARSCSARPAADTGLTQRAPDSYRKLRNSLNEPKKTAIYGPASPTPTCRFLACWPVPSANSPVTSTPTCGGATWRSFSTAFAAVTASKHYRLAHSAMARWR